MGKNQEKPRLVNALVVAVVEARVTLDRQGNVEEVVEVGSVDEVLEVKKIRTVISTH